MVHFKDLRQKATSMGAAALPVPLFQFLLNSLEHLVGLSFDRREVGLPSARAASCSGPRRLLHRAIDLEQLLASNEWRDHTSLRALGKRALVTEHNLVPIVNHVRHGYERLVDIADSEFESPSGSGSVGFHHQSPKPLVLDQGPCNGSIGRTRPSILDQWVPGTHGSRSDRHCCTRVHSNCDRLCRTGDFFHLTMSPCIQCTEVLCI